MRGFGPGRLMVCLLAVACSLTEERFLSDFETLWCDQWSVCNPDFETCPTGIERDDFGPACIYRPEEARKCLRKRDWYCDTSGGPGNEAVVRPDACDLVYECP